MAQHDYIISNQTFPNTRADINNVLSAISTNNSGTSAPTTQYAGQFWIDTTSSTWTMYIHDGSDDIAFATIDTSANTVNFTDSALDVVTDTTPQLGGNLDLNSNDITGTGNINITGTGTFSGDLTVDTNTLKVDSTNNRVGVGTASPTEVLHVVGDILATGGDFKSDANNYLGFSNNVFARFVINDSEKMRLTSTGLGIGTSAPSVKLDVRANSFTPDNTNTSLLVEAPAIFSQAQHFYINNAGSYNSGRPTGGIGAINSSNLISLSAGSICTGNPGANGFKAYSTLSSLYDIGNGEHNFKTKSGLTVGDQFTHLTRMTIKSDGKVGIGTSSPSEKLEVNGTVKATSFDGAGRVLQVIQTTKTDTATYSVGGNGGESSNVMPTNITPSSASNKVLIQGQFVLAVPTTNVGVILFRGSTEIFSSDSAGSRNRATAMSYQDTGSTGSVQTIPFTFLDSPSSTSALTYQVKFTHASSATQTIYQNRIEGDGDSSKIFRGTSSLTVMEIQA